MIYILYYLPLFKNTKDFDSNNLFDLYEQFLLIQNNEFKSFEEDFSKTVNELLISQILMMVKTILYSLSS